MHPRIPPESPDLAVDVAVVGAGLVGGALACALAAHGIRTAVIDRVDPRAMTEAGFDGRASAIAASSQVLLSAIGLWPELAPYAEPIREIRVSDGASPLFLHYDHADLGEGPLGFMVENRRMRAAIAKEMAKKTEGRKARLAVVGGAAVTGMIEDLDRIRLTLEDGSEIAAQVVIAAEGRDSRLRDLAGIAVTGWDYPQVGLVATIGHERPHGGIAHERFLPAGPFAILPLTDDDGRHRSSLVWTERKETAQEYLALDDTGFLAGIRERVGDFLGELCLIGPRFSHPLGLQFADRYGAGRLWLAGDSAHGIHPIAGQGLNLGLRDVAALTEILVDARQLGLDLAHPEGLERFERWRRADNLLMAGVTDLLNRLFSNDIAPVHLARDLGLAAVNGFPPLKRLFMRHAMGTVGDLPRLMRAS